jgi:hypothetical protein
MERRLNQATIAINLISTYVDEKAFGVAEYHRRSVVGPGKVQSAEALRSGRNLFDFF